VSEVSPAAPEMLPGMDQLNRPFWTGGLNGDLLIAHCDVCQVYVHPPVPRCVTCQAPLVPKAVSGEGIVATFTVNHQPWLPGMQVPYVFAAIELAEQRNLYVLSNVVGIPPEDVKARMKVRVRFATVADVAYPLFEPAA